MCIRDRNWIAGAGLDVFEDETRAVTESEKVLYGLPNVVLTCLLYTSDAADERSSVDLGGRRIIKKKKNGDLAHTRYMLIEATQVAD